MTRLTDALRGVGWTVGPSVTNFILVDFGSTQRAGAVAESLLLARSRAAHVPGEPPARRPPPAHRPRPLTRTTASSPSPPDLADGDSRMTTPLGDIEIGPREGRRVTVARTTRETDITVTLGLDGDGHTAIDTGIGFYDHLLGSLAHHGLFDLAIQADGDLQIDEHHTVEDVALVLGCRVRRGARRPGRHRRFGDSAVPMDESLATAVVDVGGRPYAVIDLPFRGERVGGLPLQLVEHALESFARTAGATLHLSGTGRNDHHLAEATFKALGRALRVACEIDPRRDGCRLDQGDPGMTR